MAPPRRKEVRRPPSYYVQRRKEHADAGRTQPVSADNTAKSLASQLRKVNRYQSPDTTPFVPSPLTQDL